MHSAVVLVALGAVVIQAQVPPPPQTLTAVKSGVLPVLPTPFSGVEIEEGAIVYDGPANPSFTPVNGPATVQSDLPAATYEAVLPKTNFDPLTGSTITGSIKGVSAKGASGTTFTVDFSGFPSESEYGPFVYHIHTLPVPADGNCSATMGHLDPTDRGEYYPCNVAAPDTCQVGDLAGKHGNITGSTFTASYTDPYLSTDPKSPSYFGAVSVVIHSANTTRLTCANFKAVTSGSMTTGATGASNGTTAGAASASGAAYGASGSSSSSGSASSPQAFTGAASTLSAIGVAGFMTVALGCLAML